ncbi:MAG: hypothetical protein BM557_06440 [Flavobacterium sp. MedPE-SWcel]|uniref:DUF3298 and DUF4163 domain-containing protein n=1 Tax=uncultured Flavobacterium sp. TaxID=165435 RepID=UPI00091B401D|nr:DUF3298 and DUF4163 domain-containing protein [uncultured Flavobacterium sp.]OIQ19338.1 MAG: hypothetical protein BM557_06440 [Flavobacterium sp. MedPE-SWcel]
MKHYIAIAFIALLFTACGKDKKEATDIDTVDTAKLTFEVMHYDKETISSCTDCPNINMDISVAEGLQPAADSINKAVFNVAREIIHYGKDPYSATDYKELTESFVKSYTDLKKEYPDETAVWEGSVKAAVAHRTDDLINVVIEYYTFTGGAHGNAGIQSLLFDPKTGHHFANREIFNDLKGFTDYAEKKFRKQLNIEAMDSINSTGLLFEDGKFSLPNSILFTDKGVMLYYNAYEISSYSEGTKELVLPYEEIEQYLRIK